MLGNAHLRQTQACLRAKFLRCLLRPPLMKNANIFIDVDLTLIDADGRLLDGAREALNRLRDEGCHLFLWSSCGAEYCRKIAGIHGLTEVFEGFTAKPDIL